ncbi:hypothetical protein [Muninn virus]|nr:hypothetical protein [Muninn virus]
MKLVKCSVCGHIFLTKKEFKIQCGFCGKRKVEVIYIPKQD